MDSGSNYEILGGRVGIGRLLIHRRMDKEPTTLPQRIDEENRDEDTIGPEKAIAL